MDSPISQLPAAQNTTPADIVPIVQGGVTSRATMAQLKTGLKTITAFIGSVSRTFESVLLDFFNSRSIGTASDGATDDTATLTSFFTGNAAFRGVLRLPYGTKFSNTTVYGAAPTGVILWDESCINTGQPPGYKNKMVTMWASDTDGDDSSFQIGSGHHPCIRLNNSAASGTTSGSNYYHSIIRSAGFRWNKDPIDGMQWLTFKSPRGALWRTTDLVNTAYDYAVNAKAQWTAGTNYAAGAKVNTSDGNVYQTTAGGIAGPAKPVGTGAGISDGTVLWNYLGPWSVSRTTHYYDEDGYGGVIGVTKGRWGAESANRKGLSLNVDDATGDVNLRDDQRNQDLWRVKTAVGLQSDFIQSDMDGGNISGATPAVTGAVSYVNNVGATNMTDILLPAGQTSATIKLHFANANTTLKWAGSNFTYLKGSVDVTPPANGVMVFRKTSRLSSGWFEDYRNF